MFCFNYPDKIDTKTAKGPLIMESKEGAKVIEGIIYI